MSTRRDASEAPEASSVLHPDLDGLEAVPLATSLVPPSPAAPEAPPVPPSAVKLGAPLTRKGSTFSSVIMVNAAPAGRLSSSLNNGLNPEDPTPEKETTGRTVTGAKGGPSEMDAVISTGRSAR
jgi:hypothetical protein